MNMNYKDEARMVREEASYFERMAYLAGLSTPEGSYYLMRAQDTYKAAERLELYVELFK